MAVCEAGGVTWAAGNPAAGTATGAVPALMIGLIVAPSLYRAQMAATGIWLRPSEYGEPYPIARELLEDGARWSILPGPVNIDCPVRILQGGADPDVPWRHALELAQAIRGDDVVFSLIKDGDLTGFGLVNAVTGYAQEVDQYDRSTELESIGGRMLDQAAKEWTELAEAA